jgi:hypothetical protein
MNTFKKNLAASCTSILLFGSILAAGTYFDGWNIETDQQGHVVRMILDNPHNTPLGIEKQLTIEINSDLTVSGGHVVFTNGFDRSMGRMEAEAYWEFGNGPHVLWNYYESVGKLITLSSNDRIPNDWAGRTVRFVTRINTEVFGTLLLTNDADRYGINANQYMLPGACCGPIYFTPAALLKLQTLK